MQKFWLRRSRDSQSDRWVCPHMRSGACCQTASLPCLSSCAQRHKGLFCCFCTFYIYHRTPAGICNESGLRCNVRSLHLPCQANSAMLVEDCIASNLIAGNDVVAGLHRLYTLPYTFYNARCFMAQNGREQALRICMRRQLACIACLQYTESQRRLTFA